MKTKPIKPTVKFNGKVIVEWGNGDFLTMFPNGVIKVFASREGAMDAANAFFRQKAKGFDKAIPAIGVGMIEWRLIRTSVGA